MSVCQTQPGSLPRQRCDRGCAGSRLIYLFLSLGRRLGDDAVPVSIGLLRGHFGRGMRLRHVPLSRLSNDQHAIELGLRAARDCRHQIYPAYSDPEPGTLLGEVLQAAVDRVHQVRAELLTLGAKALVGRGAGLRPGDQDGIEIPRRAHSDRARDEQSLKRRTDVVGRDQITDRIFDLVKQCHLQMHDAEIAGQQEAGVLPRIIAHVESGDRVGSGRAAEPASLDIALAGPPPAGVKADDPEFDLPIGRRQHDDLLDRPRPSEQQTRFLLSDGAAKSQDDGAAVRRHLQNVRHGPSRRDHRNGDEQKSERDLGRLRPDAIGLGTVFGTRRHHFALAGSEAAGVPTVPFGPSTSTLNGAASVLRISLVFPSIT